MHLASAFEDVGAFTRRVGRDAVEVGGSLLELGEVLHGLHRPLRTEQALNVQAPQRWRVDPMPMLIGPNIADRVGGGVRMAVGVTVEAGHALRGLQAAAVFDGVELLLGKRRDQQPQSFELLGIEDVLEQLVEVAERHQFPLRDVAQIRPCCQIDRRRELGQKMIRQVEVEVEASQIPIGLLLRFLDEEFGEDHAARFVVGMRQRKKTGGPELLFLDFLRRQGREFLPGHARWQLDAHAVLHRLAARHGRSPGRPVSEVVARREQILLALRERRFLRLKAFYQGGEVFSDDRRCLREADNRRGGQCGQEPSHSRPN